MHVCGDRGRLPRVQPWERNGIQFPRAGGVLCQKEAEPASSAFATGGEIIGGVLGALVPGADVTGASEVGGALVLGGFGGWLGNKLGGWLTGTPSAR